MAFILIIQADQEIEPSIDCNNPDNLLQNCVQHPKPKEEGSSTKLSNQTETPPTTLKNEP
uniref:Uncharacterized protein n=1 Tax=Meloidogyne hapla TaxID=6305 RepID=A0A1I8B190_MELHA